MYEKGMSEAGAYNSKVHMPSAKWELLTVMTEEIPSNVKKRRGKGP